MQEEKKQSSMTKGKGRNTANNKELGVFSRFYHNQKVQSSNPREEKCTEIASGMQNKTIFIVWRQLTLSYLVGILTGDRWCNLQPDVATITGRAQLSISYLRCSVLPQPTNRGASLHFSTLALQSATTVLAQNLYICWAFVAQACQHIKFILDHNG